MKKTLLSIVISVLTLTAFAQDIRIVDPSGNNIIGDTVYLDEAVDTTLAFEQSFENKGFSTIYNSGNDAITIALIRYEETIVPGTGDALCWGNTCYNEVQNTPVWVIGDTVRVAPGDTAGSLLGGFVTYHYPHNKVGNSTYRYEFYDLNRPLNTPSELYVQYRISYLTSINENILKSNQVSIYPNPAINLVTINLDANIAGKSKLVQVKDLTGKLVLNSSFLMNSNKLNLDVSALESGIYFVNVLVENNNMVTKKLIVQ